MWPWETASKPRVLFLGGDQCITRFCIVVRVKASMLSRLARSSWSLMWSIAWAASWRDSAKRVCCWRTGFKDTLPGWPIRPPSLQLGRLPDCADAVYLNGFFHAVAGSLRLLFLSLCQAGLEITAVHCRSMPVRCSPPSPQIEPVGLPCSRKLPPECIPSHSSSSRGQLRCNRRSTRLASSQSPYRCHSRNSAECATSTVVCVRRGSWLKESRRDLPKDSNHRLHHPRLLAHG